MGDRKPAGLADHLGEQRGLVEPPRPLAPPVQRHRQEQIGLPCEVAARMRHPAAHDRGEIEPVGIFQGVHQGAGGVVETDRRACPGIGRRVGDRLQGEDPGARIERKRNAEPLAIGRRDEGELGPAGGAQALAGDRLAAGGAELRQRHAERQPEDRARGPGQAGEPPGPRLVDHGVRGHAQRLSPGRCGRKGPAAAVVSG